MKIKIALGIVILLALVLRIWQLGVNPPSLTWDEVAWGYNAYSLGIDGHDEFGKFLPHDYLESFGDFKPPIYAYLTILPVKLFGLTELATRFPSAVLGVATVLLTYFLVLELFPQQKNKQWLGLASAGILAISPWHINLSRAAFEANVATFFVVAGVWLFLLALRKNSWYFCLSAVSFVITFYTFNTPRVVVPLLVTGLAIFSYQELLKRKKQVGIAALVGVLLLLPTFGFLFSPQAKLRFAEVNIFSDIGVIQRSNQAVLRDNNAPWSIIIHNRRFLFTIEFMKHFFDNLTPQFLFIQGDGNPKFSTQDVGQLYLWELPFLLLGAGMLFKNREGKWWVIPFWLVVGIIPAATARETPHALRTEITLPTFQILTAYGVVYAGMLIHSFRKTNRYALLSLKVGAVILASAVIVSLLYYLHGYYNSYPQQFSGEWQYGYKQAIQFVKQHNDTYQKIYMTEDLGRPYIYFLFYLQFSPQQFRQSASIERETLGFVHVTHFDKYYFAKDIRLLPKAEAVLYIDTPEKIPPEAHVAGTFKLLNGNTALVAYTK